MLEQIDVTLSKRVPTQGGSECDVFSGWRRIYSYTQRPGVCKWVKRKYNRRLRATHKQEIRAALK